MINSLLLIDDEDLFHLIFEDYCSILDIATSFKAVNSSDIADQMFRTWFESGETNGKPECVLVDHKLHGSSITGIEMIERINYNYGNGVVIGVISNIDDITEITDEIETAKSAGAQFWLNKSHDLEPRLIEFKLDYGLYDKRIAPFKIYN